LKSHIPSLDFPATAQLEGFDQPQDELAGFS